MAEPGKRDSNNNTKGMNQGIRPEAPPREYALSENSPSMEVGNVGVGDSPERAVSGVIRRLRESATDMGEKVRDKTSYFAGNLNTTIKEHPGNSLMASIAVGFMLGAAVTFLVMHSSDSAY